jgi:hypothetical protein
MYILHVKFPWITLNMVYGVSKELSHKILVHHPCSLKLMDSSQSAMELGIPFVKIVTHRIFAIYALNRPWELFFDENTVKGKTYTTNITYDIDSKS